MDAKRVAALVKDGFRDGTDRGLLETTLVLPHARLTCFFVIDHARCSMHLASFWADRYPELYDWFIDDGRVALISTDGNLWLKAYEKQRKGA